MATTQFFMTVYKSKGAEGQTNPFLTCERSFGVYF
jgi:hypothetical protein